MDRLDSMVDCISAFTAHYKRFGDMESLLDVKRTAQLIIDLCESIELKNENKTP